MSRLTTPGSDQAVEIDTANTDIDTGNLGVSVNNAEALTADGTISFEWDGTGLTWTNTGDGDILTNTATQVTIDYDGDTVADVTIDITQALVDGDTVTLDVTGSTAGAWDTLDTADVNEEGFYEFQADFIGGTTTSTIQDLAFDIGTRWNGTTQVPDSLATTQYASSSTTVYQSADGYGAGALQGVDVDVDGLITGSYSNGQVLPLYKLSLAKFQSVTNLKKEGGNIYSETRQSGEATTSLPGTNGLGSIAPNSLEQSNVDIANEFVKMITTQRGFQANSKIITVTDDMLAELINLKR